MTRQLRRTTHRGAQSINGQLPLQFEIVQQQGLGELAAPFDQQAADDVRQQLRMQDSQTSLTATRTGPASRDEASLPDPPSRCSHRHEYMAAHARRCRSGSGGSGYPTRHLQRRKGRIARGQGSKVRR
jgi:hypothetical protein